MSEAGSRATAHISRSSRIPCCSRDHHEISVGFTYSSAHSEAILTYSESVTYAIPWTLHVQGPFGGLRWMTRLSFRKTLSWRRCQTETHSNGGRLPHSSGARWPNWASFDHRPGNQREALRPAQRVIRQFTRRRGHTGDADLPVQGWKQVCQGLRSLAALHEA